MKAPHGANYRVILKDQFELRNLKNPHFSLRAFARLLGLSPTRLSDIFRERQGLSHEAASRISSRLGFTFEETDWFCALVGAEHARSRASRLAARERVKKLCKQRSAHVIGLDGFRLVSDWHYLAILELGSVPGFALTAEGISARLGISASQAASSLETLKSLELLVERDGGLVASRRFVATPSDIPSESIRRYHEQILAKARIALFEHPVPVRDFSAITFAISESQLPEAKKMIREFRRRFLELIEKAAGRDHVYSMAIQLFSLERRPK